MSHQPHSNLLVRLIWNMCQCIIDSEYQETLNEEEREPPPLSPQSFRYKGKITLVLDMDETLIHSAPEAIPNWDFTVPFIGEEGVSQRYVKKRPGLDQFLARMGELFEVVIFTASTESYASAVIRNIDPDGVVQGCMFRDSCIFHPSGFLKDLRRVNRSLPKVIIIDVTHTQNSPVSYSLQPENAIPILTWFHDETDKSLLELIPLLESIADSDDVCKELPRIRGMLGQSVAMDTIEKGMHEHRRSRSMDDEETTLEITSLHAQRCQTDV